MIELKAAFAGCTIRALKKVLYRFMQDLGYEYTHEGSQFFTTLTSRKKVLGRLDTQECQKIRLPIPSTQQATTPLRGFRRTKN